MASVILVFLTTFPDLAHLTYLVFRVGQIDCLKHQKFEDEGQKN